RYGVRDPAMGGSASTRPLGRDTHRSRFGAVRLVSPRPVELPGVRASPRNPGSRDRAPGRLGARLAEGRTNRLGGRSVAGSAPNSPSHPRSDVGLPAALLTL